MSKVGNRNGRAWYAVVILMIAYALAFLDRTILSLMIIPIQRDLGLSDTQFGLLAGFAFVLFYSTAGMPIGWLADRYSRRGIVGIGIALWSVMTMACGLAGNFGQLFLARVGVGIGEAALNPCAYSIIGDSFPKERLARAISVFSTGSMIGSGLAFAFGGLLIKFLVDAPDLTVLMIGKVHAWQLAFFVAGLPGILVAALVYTIHEPRRPVPPTADGASMRAFLDFLKVNKQVLFYHASGFSAFTLVVYALLTWMPALLMRKHGMDPAAVGVIMGGVTGFFGLLGFVGGGFMADYLIQKGYDDAHLRVGVIGGSVGLPFALLAPLAPNATTAVMALCLAFLFITLPSGSGVAGLQLITPSYLRARVSSIFMVVINIIGLGLGPVLVPILTDYAFHDKEAIDRSIALVSGGFTILMVSCYFLGLPFSQGRCGAKVTGSKARIV